MPLLHKPVRWCVVSLFVLSLGVIWTLASRIPAEATTNGARSRRG